MGVGVECSHAEVVVGDDLPVLQEVRTGLHDFGDYLLGGEVVHEFFGNVEFEFADSVHVLVDLLRLAPVGLGQLLDFLELGQDVGVGIRVFGVPSGMDRRSLGQFEQLHAHRLRLLAPELAQELLLKRPARVLARHPAELILHILLTHINSEIAS